MTRIITGLTALIARAITHEGAAACDLSIDSPLEHLVFTKGSTLFATSFYRSQEEELFSYSRALLAAERHEPGFAWKFAAYMRDPKNGKGNRIQGTIAAAILCTAYPCTEFTEEYTYRCLKHRADDLVLFLCHFINLGLGDIPEAARRAMARAANEMDEYQLLKYSGRQFTIARYRRKGKKRVRASLRLADALGIARKYLSPDKLAIYNYLHAPTRLKDRYAEALSLAPHRRRFFKHKQLEDAERGRCSLEQILSTTGTGKMAWENFLDMDGILPDLAFKNYIRCMYRSGVSTNKLIFESNKRKFEGIWPHQIYAGYRSAKDGSIRYKTGKEPRRNFCGEVRYRSVPCPNIEEVFESVLSRVTKNCLPPGLNLGLADISPSMFSCPLGGMQGSIMAGDVAVLFSSLMAKDLGYAATFGDHLQILKRENSSNDLSFAELIRRQGKGWGSTQVAGSVAELIQLLAADPSMPRPRTLFFFSDMQFHPAPSSIDPIARNFMHLAPWSKPPLVAAIEAYRQLIGPVKVVLWNLASYDNSPAPADMEDVIMLSGFDANTFKSLLTDDRRPARSAPSPGRDNSEKSDLLQVVRSF
ncbi:MAG: hypothetical protein KC777_29490 [Cyanobacteria bacterium HKST-UBA02]|nr:hypothetical protein [Cyanobacteria bacterium HKST-UBA02]